MYILTLLSRDKLCARNSDENLWEAGQVQDIVYTDMADMETDIILPDIVFVLPEYDVRTGLFRSRV